MDPEPSPGSRALPNTWSVQMDLAEVWESHSELTSQGQLQGASQLQHVSASTERLISVCWGNTAPSYTPEADMSQTLQAVNSEISGTKPWIALPERYNMSLGKCKEFLIQYSLSFSPALPSFYSEPEVYDNHCNMTPDWKSAPLNHSSISGESILSHLMASLSPKHPHDPCEHVHHPMLKAQKCTLTEVFFFPWCSKSHYYTALIDSRAAGNFLDDENSNNS